MEHFRGLLTALEEEADVLLYGLPYDGATSIKSGASLAPQLMRTLSCYLPPVSWDGSLIDLKIKDMGDCSDFTGKQVDLDLKRLYSKNKFMLFLGGDHSVSIKTQFAFLNQFANKKVGIIHFDAHADMCDVYDHSKVSHACVNRRAIEAGIDSNNIVYIGIRSWEVQELEFFKGDASGEVYSMAHIHQIGVEKVITQVIKKFNDFDAIYLSFDIDAIDPSSAPGTGTPEAGGLMWTQARQMVCEFIKRLNVVSMDMVEVSPPLDVNDITSWAALKLIYEALCEIAKKKGD